MKFTGNKDLIINLIKSNLKDDKEYDVTINEASKKRTINQNNYYWSLLTKYSEWVHISKSQLHNQMLIDYGVRTGDFVILPETANVDDYENIHLAPSGKQMQDSEGNRYYEYQIIKGSSFYNTKEMTELIQGLINDIQGSEAPIDTLTDLEIQQYWG